MQTIDQIAELGIVGAGGAGFPVHVKLQAPVDTVIVNGAECEPLLHKDKELMRAYPEEIMAGLRIAMEHTEAKAGVFGVKYKYTDVIAKLESLCTDGLRVHQLPDTYPAGDEFILIYEVTGAVIPPGGLPKDVGALSQNVETLLNLARGEAVTHKYLTVAGAVNHPVTIKVPIGTSFRECIEAAAGATCEDFAVITGGVMMGQLAEDIEGPVTKRTGAVLVFPSDHPLLAKYRRTEEHTVRIGRSACDQCSFCTDMCPRWLLGHPIEPHRAMRALGFHDQRAQLVIGASYCCECNLCSLMACPEDLDPRGACVRDKGTAREAGIQHPLHHQPTTPHAMYSHRRTPVSRLMVKLGLKQFNNVGPLVEESLKPSRVRIPMQQHVGAPCEPSVKKGDKVKTGDVIGKVPSGKLGAPIHASIDGKIADVAGGAVVIER